MFTRPDIYDLPDFQVRIFPEAFSFPKKKEILQDGMKYSYKEDLYLKNYTAFAHFEIH